VRRRRRKHPIAPEAQLGLAWYTRAAWERLRELAADKDALDDSFEDWERGALAAIGEFKAAGREIRKVPIDVEALAVWCAYHNRKLDGRARAAYVTHLLQTAPGD
jgi:hypothetical protein